MGISFGGYLAPRAASGEPRLACIADPDEFALFEELKSRVPGFVAKALPDGSRFILGLMNLIARRRMRQSARLRLAGPGVRMRFEAAKDLESE